MLWILILVFATNELSEIDAVSHLSSVMYGEKPILRMGNEDKDEEEHKEILREPRWVSNLRSTIEEQVKKLGFEGAGKSISKIISDVADDVEELGLQGNEEPTAQDYSVKKGLRTIAAAEENRQHKNKKRGGEPEWIADLKSFVRELISKNGKNELEHLVRPVIQSVEGTHHVKIKDIDGEIFINYENQMTHANPVMPPIKVSHKPKKHHRRTLRKILW